MYGYIFHNLKSFNIRPPFSVNAKTECNSMHSTINTNNLIVEHMTKYVSLAAGSLSWARSMSAAKVRLGPFIVTFQLQHVLASAIIRR